jgi:hypothetical protein
MVVKPIAKLSEEPRPRPSSPPASTPGGSCPTPTIGTVSKRSATTYARIAEVQPEGWLGEVEGLQISPRRAAVVVRTSRVRASSRCLRSEHRLSISPSSTARYCPSRRVRSWIRRR